MHLTQARKFFALFFLQILVLSGITVLLNSELSSYFRTYHQERMPNLRAWDWLYHDIQLREYVRYFVNEYGKDRVIAYIGDSVLYQDGARPDATIAVVSERLINRTAKEPMKVLNLGVLGTDELYLYEAIEECINLDVAHIVVFVTLRDLYYFQSGRTEAFTEDTYNGRKLLFEDHELLEAESFFGSFGQRNRGITPLEWKLNRAVMKPARWMCAPGFLVDSLLTAIFPVKKLPEATALQELKSADPDFRGDKRSALQPGRFLAHMSTLLEPPAAYAQEEPEPVPTVLTLRERIIYRNTFIASIEAILKRFAAHKDKISFVVVPANEVYEIPQLGADKDIPKLVSDTLVTVVRNADYEIHAGEPLYPGIWFRPEDPVHLNFYGSWKLVEMIAKDDSYVGKMMPNISSIGFPELSTSPGHLFTQVKTKPERIQYISGDEVFRLVSVGGEVTCFEIPADDPMLIEGFMHSMIPENAGPKIRVFAPGDTGSAIDHVFDKQVRFSLRRTKLSADLLVDGQRTTVRLNPDKRWMVRIGFDDMNTSDREFMLAFNSAFYIGKPSTTGSPVPKK